jgi:hypothetical protein
VSKVLAGSYGGVTFNPKAHKNIEIFTDNNGDTLAEATTIRSQAKAISDQGTKIFFNMI